MVVAAFNQHGATTPSVSGVVWIASAPQIANTWHATGGAGAEQGKCGSSFHRYKYKRRFTQRGKSYPVKSTCFEIQLIRFMFTSTNTLVFGEYLTLRDRREI